MTRKRLISILITAMMILSLIPATALTTLADEAVEIDVPLNVSKENGSNSINAGFFQAWDAKDYYVPATGVSLASESVFGDLAYRSYESSYDESLGAGLGAVAVEALAVGSAAWQSSNAARGMNYNVTSLPGEVFGGAYKGVVTYKLPAGITGFKAWFGAGMAGSAMDIIVHDEPLDYTQPLDAQHDVTVVNRVTLTSVSVDRPGNYLTVMFNYDTPADAGRRMLDLVVTVSGTFDGGDPDPGTNPDPDPVDDPDPDPDPGTNPDPNPDPNPGDITVDLDTLDPRPFDQEFDGVKLGEDGHLVPSAWNAVDTFEKDASKPSRHVFVSPYGNDALDGGTPATAWKTISKAVGAATPGTAVWLMPGAYPKEDSGRISISGKGGTAENPIWIGGIPGEEPPVLQAGTAIYVDGAVEFIVFHDMDIDNAWGFLGNSAPHAAHLGTDSFTSSFGQAPVRNIVMRGLSIHGYNNSGIKLSTVDNIWVFDCEIYGQQPDNTPNPNGSGGVIRAAASVDAVSCGYLTYAYNYVHDFASTALSVKGGSYECGMYGNLIARGGLGLQLGQTTGIQFFRPSATMRPGTVSEAENCYAYSNILIDLHTPFDVGSSINCYAVNNTVYIKTPMSQRNPVTFSRWFRICNTNQDPMLFMGGTPAYGTVANNLLYIDSETLKTNGFELGLNTPGYPGAIETFNIRRNMFSADPVIADFGTGNASLFWQKNGDVSDLAIRDPLFVNATSDERTMDYHLREGSPAIGAGNNGARVLEIAKTDFYGNPFHPTQRSIGAVESDFGRPDAAPDVADNGERKPDDGGGDVEVPVQIPLHYNADSWYYQKYYTPAETSLHDESGFGDLASSSYAGEINGVPVEVVTVCVSYITGNGGTSIIYPVPPTVFGDSPDAWHDAQNVAGGYTGAITFKLPRAIVGWQLDNGVVFDGLEVALHANPLDYTLPNTLSTTDVPATQSRNGTAAADEGFRYITIFVNPDYYPVSPFNFKLHVTLASVVEEPDPVDVSKIAVIAGASVLTQNGNTNILTVTVTELYSDGSIVDLVETFTIENNTADEYVVGEYIVYVDTKGNDQIRECYIVG